MGKRKGYNWRARVDQPTGRLEENGGTHEDTNMLKLPAKKTRKSSEVKQGNFPKKKKLSIRQKKNFKKIVERKEKKAKVCVKLLGQHVFTSRDIL